MLGEQIFIKNIKHRFIETSVTKEQHSLFVYYKPRNFDDTHYNETFLLATGVLLNSIDSITNVIMYILLDHSKQTVILNSNYNDSYERERTR